MYFYGEQNKSRWEGGQKKIKKRYQYFFKKGVLRGGHNVAKWGTQNFVPPLKKSPRTPLSLHQTKHSRKKYQINVFNTPHSSVSDLKIVIALSFPFLGRGTTPLPPGPPPCLRQWKRGLPRYNHVQEQGSWSWTWRIQEFIGVGGGGVIFYFFLSPPENHNCDFFRR